MNEKELKDRTKQLAVAVAGVVDGLPSKTSAHTYGRQLIRSSSSVAANYRAACRGRSDLEMLAKFGTVEEEADESQLWIELLVDCGHLEKAAGKDLHRAYGEVVAIMVASKRTLRKRLDRDGNKPR